MRTERYLVKVFHDDGVHPPFETASYTVYSGDELTKFLKKLEKELKSAKKTLKKSYIKTIISVSALSGLYKKAWEYTKEINYRD